MIIDNFVRRELLILILVTHIDQMFSFIDSDFGIVRRKLNILMRAAATCSHFAIAAPYHSRMVKADLVKWLGYGLARLYEKP